MQAGSNLVSIEQLTVTAAGDKVSPFQHIEHFCGLVADGTSARRNAR